MDDRTAKEGQMRRLGAETLADLNSAVRLPAYDWRKLGIGMAHLGLGAFHRCHQAEYTDDAIAARGGDWGTVGINLRPPFLRDSLRAQDGLYARRLREGTSVDECRIIGCIRETIDAQNEPTRAIAALADPRIKLVTLTITEKGYCHIPATGLLDERHPDILYDRAHPEAPRSAPGIILAALERRRQAEVGGVTLLSCDNIPANGIVLGGVVRALAEARSPALAAWIADCVAFPSSMVDRIVPATTEVDVAALSETLGLEDRACVVGEPFRQWAIENHFVAGRPSWEAAGAEFVQDVAPYELIKMRVLNGAQTTLCSLGALADLEFTFEDVAHPTLLNFVRRMLEEETAPTLPHAPGMEPGAYIDLSLRRLRNSSIRHRNHQIATDGSQKIVQRLLNPLRERLRAGASIERLACATAGFIAYLAAAAPRFGARWTPSDPFAAPLRKIADETAGDLLALTQQTMAISAIFGADLPQRPHVVSTIARHLAGLLSDDPLAYLDSL
jgi:fructuronate reductase